VNREAELDAERKKLDAAVMHVNTVVCAGKHDGGRPTEEYTKLMGPVSGELDRCLLALVAERFGKGTGSFSRKNVWLWGGPTPYWGGSMEKDTSVKGAAYFGIENVVYVYGAVDEEAMEIHKECRRLLCQLTRINRTPDAQSESNVENAERLSRLSLAYPNIEGGIIDDLIGNYGRSISRDEVRDVYRGLKKHNAAMRLYAVVYASELELACLPILAPYIDCVNLWVWRKTDLPDLDLIVEKCRAAFPGKEIMMGVFMHDYGASDLGMPSGLLEFQLERARRYVLDGRVRDVVILGDREIAKWPDAARTVKRFLDTHC